MNDNATKVFQQDPSKSMEENSQAFKAFLEAGQKRKKKAITPEMKRLILTGLENGFSKSYIAVSLGVSNKAVETVINESKEVKA